MQGYMLLQESISVHEYCKFECDLSLVLHPCVLSVTMSNLVITGLSPCRCMGSAQGDCCNGGAG
jgi:hypothetical protein